MPNHIQNWDMVYAMRLSTANLKLAAIFTENTKNKNDTQTNFDSQLKTTSYPKWDTAKTATDNAKVALNHALGITIKYLLSTSTPTDYKVNYGDASTFLDVFKNGVSNAFEKHLLTQTKYQSPNYQQLKTKASTAEITEAITNETNYLVNVVKLQVQNAILAVATKDIETSDEAQIHAMIKESVAVMYPQDCCDTLFHTKGTTQLKINIEAWSFVIDRTLDSNWIKIKIPFKTSTLTGYEAKDLIGGHALIKLNLNWVRLSQKTEFNALIHKKINEADTTVNEFVELTLEGFSCGNISGTDIGTVHSYFVTILNNSFGGQTQEVTTTTDSSSIAYLYNRLFASLGVFETLAVKADDEKAATKSFRFAWMYPTTIEYAFTYSYDLSDKDDSQLADSVFGILCMTEGRKNKEKPAIDINIIPQGNDSAIIITPTLLMQHIVKPKIIELFTTDDATDKAKKIPAIDKNFSEITPTSFESKTKLYFKSDMKNKKQNVVQPSIEKEKFSFGLDNNRLVLNFGAINYNWDGHKYFKVTLQHKTKGSFSWDNNTCIAMKTDSSITTPDVTPLIRIAPWFQQTVDWSSTGLSALLFAEIFEVRAKKHFMENATNHLSSTYHNHVTNDMDALQKLLLEENKKFIADLNKHKKVLTDYLLINNVSLSIKLYVREILEDYLILESVGGSNNSFKSLFSLKISETTSEFKYGGMLLINHKISETADIALKKTVSLHDAAKEVWIDRYQTGFSSIRSQLKAKLAYENKAKDKTPNNTHTNPNTNTGTQLTVIGHQPQKLHPLTFSFLSVAIGTTEPETAEFIKQLYKIDTLDKNYFEESVLETKMKKVNVVFCGKKSSPLPANNVVYLLLQMDDKYFFLKTNSKKNEYGGFELVTYSSTRTSTLQGIIDMDLDEHENENENKALQELLNQEKPNDVASMMEHYKKKFQEIRYALSLIIYKDEVFEEFKNSLNKKKFLWITFKHELKVGNFVFKEVFRKVTEDKIFIALEGYYYDKYSHLGLKLTAQEVKLFGVNKNTLNNTADWENKQIKISDFEKQHPDSFRQLMNELKRIAFTKDVNLERREFWIDFGKDTLSGTFPIVLSKLSEWLPPEDPTNAITTSGEITNIETIIDTALNAIKWPGQENQGLTLITMDLDGNFRLSFKIPIT